MRQVEKVRHTITSEDEGGLLELKQKNWLYFIEIVLEMSEKEKFELENEENDIDLESKLLLNIISNLQICKHCYNTLSNSCTDNLQEMIFSSYFSYMQSVNEDMKLNGWGLLNLSESGSSKIIKVFDYFY